MFSPDGSTVLTSSDDNTARLWDARTGASRAELRGHTRSVNSAVFSPDGSTVLTSSDDNTARLWDARTGDSIAELRGHTHAVWEAVFSPDGAAVLTRSGDIVRLWDAKTGASIVVLRGHTGDVASAVFSPDGSTVLTASTDHTARLWDARTGASIVVLRGHTGWVNDAVFSPDGSTVLTKSGDRTARLWDAKTGAALSILQVPDGEFEATLSILQIPIDRGREAVRAKFSPDGATVLLNKGGDTVYLLDPAKATRTVLDLPGNDKLLSLRVAALLGGPIGEPALEITTPDGSRRIVGSPDQTVQFFTVPDGSDPNETPRKVATFAMPASIANLTFTPDGTRLVIELDDGSARIFDTRSAEEQAADVQRRWAERVPAGEYLNTLMAGPTPTDELMSVIKADNTLTPLRRLAAAEVLEERLADIEYQADRAFEAITKDQTDKAQVLAAAQAADLPARVKERVLAKAEAWEYTP